jgi:hypothetical protein
MGFSRVLNGGGKTSVSMGDRQRAVLDDISARAAIKAKTVDAGALSAINSEEFSFAPKNEVSNETILKVAGKYTGGGLGMQLDPEVESIVNKAKQRVAAVSTGSFSDHAVAKVTSDVFTADNSEKMAKPGNIIMNKESSKNDLEKQKANLILKRNAKMKKMEWTQDKNLKVEVADMNREIKKIDSRIQGL